MVKEKRLLTVEILVTNKSMDVDVYDYNYRYSYSLV